eukprot:TRINITY_DN1989_c0_g1_i1.p1 TRINITY_DN1989_c0_g1~~TRINITY_DN1989_c0_g1_i1.p1  ORF type:complete len:384 (-),score=108.48 TRINITY_DN1989_c0_g1_i1:1159-2247(-)
MNFASSYVLATDSDSEDVAVGELQYSDGEFDSCSDSSSGGEGDDTAQRVVKKVKKADTNVVAVHLGELEMEECLMSGDPVFCASCGAALSCVSKVVACQASTWVCDFCGHPNEGVVLDEEEVPRAETVQYIDRAAASKAAATATSLPRAGGSKTVVFCVDTSGSMCVTTEVSGKKNLKGGERLGSLSSLNTERADQYLPTQRRDTTWVSRLQCVQGAVDTQFQQLASQYPESHVGLVSFASEVTFGTGDSQCNIGGDKLLTFEDLKEFGAGAGAKLTTPISQARAGLSKKVFELEEGGQTALGPALLVSVAVASQTPGSSVIVCTDGLANVGLGSLDGGAEEVAAASAFYSTFRFCSRFHVS